MNWYTYDLETLVNFFSFSGKFANSPEIYTFEISDRMNERDKLLAHLNHIQSMGVTMVGYNSLGFDSPILHDLLNNPYSFDAARASKLCKEIINNQEYGFTNAKMSDRLIPQLDLAKVNHFDNRARRTSLKSLQFAMRSESVEDIPYDPNLPVTPEQMDKMREYNVHDILETEKFLFKCMPAIKMRQDLVANGVLNGDVLNFSDVRIGTEYLIKKIGRAKCFLAPGVPRQSKRTSIPLKSIILPKIFFRTEPFQHVLDWFNEQTITISKVKGKSVTSKMEFETKLAGLEFKFGKGGVHASVDNRIFESDDNYIIKDIDVGGMYPSIAASNGFHPEHLGQQFVDAYRQLAQDRKQYPKGSSMNALLKLASNGAYGNSNNEYSPFYDPKFTFTITVNGQLQLIQLAEVISLIPGTELIQANTDGITVRVPRKLEHLFHLWCNEWEAQTGLKLEEFEYKKMFIRDTNNYLGIKTNGDIKRKGAYFFPESDEDYSGIWNKDFSNLVAPKAVQRVMLANESELDVVRCIVDKFDFMLRYKTPSGAKVYLGDKECPKTLRYYVSTAGAPLKKIAKPKGTVGHFKRRNKLSNEFYEKILSEIPVGTWSELIHTKNKSKYKEVVTSIESGRLIKECNHVRNFNWNDVDYSYYANEVSKLVIGRTNV